MARAAGAADFLDAIGAPVGRPIVTLLTSTPVACALAIGAAASDRPIAPLGPRLTARELEPIVQSLDGELIVAEESSAELAHTLAASTGKRMTVLRDVLPSARLLPTAADAHRPAAILHTSGTTGRPKPVHYLQGALVHRVALNSELVGLSPGAVYATASPFHHIAGLGMLFVAMGSGAALMPLPRFDIDAWRRLAGHGVTHALVVPTMIEMLLDTGELAVPGLRVLQYGASPIRPETLARAMHALPGVRFVNIFGQTEGSPITALTMDDHERACRDRPDLLGSVGRAARTVELRIEHPDEDGVGEVVARAPHLFHVGADGWLHTGDLGRLDDEGYLFLSGRKGDKIVCGGENVLPMEVENVLATHPSVAEACVFGLADDRYGEIVAAAVVAVPDTELPSWDDLRAYVRESLAGFKVPTRWEVLDELPRNAAGKVLRRQLISERMKQGRG